MSASAHFSSTYTKTGMIQRRLAWPLRKDDTQIREAFHIKKKKSQLLEPHPRLPKLESPGGATPAPGIP